MAWRNRSPVSGIAVTGLVSCGKHWLYEYHERIQLKKASEYLRPSLVERASNGRCQELNGELSLGCSDAGRESDMGMASLASDRSDRSRNV